MFGHGPRMCIQSRLVGDRIGRPRPVHGHGFLMCIRRLVGIDVV